MEPGGADSAAARAGLTRLADDTPTVEPTANSRPRRLTLPRGNMPSRHGQSSACIFLQLLILSIPPLPLYSGYRSERLRYLREGFGQFVRQIHHDVMPAGQFDDIPSWGSGKFVGEIPERTGVPAIGQISPDSKTGISNVASACGTQRRLTHSRFAGETWRISAVSGCVIPLLFSRPASRKAPMNCSATGGSSALCSSANKESPSSGTKASR